MAEIEVYQRVIDGARQVMDAYQPRISVRAEWERVRLGEVCELNPLKSELKGWDETTEVSFVPMADLNENRISFQPKEVRPLGEVVKGYTYFKNRDVLLAKVTPCFENGKSGIAENLTNGIGFGSSEYYVLRANEATLPEWIYLFVSNEKFKNEGKLKMTGTGGLQRVPKEFVSSYEIPLPPLAEQRAIVADIEAEQALVAANRELIGRMEAKIKARLAEVWGHPAAEPILEAAPAPKPPVRYELGQMPLPLAAEE